MADDKSKHADRIRVSAGEPYEVGYFAKKYDMSREDAERIIRRYGPDRDAAYRAASEAACPRPSRGGLWLYDLHRLTICRQTAQARLRDANSLPQSNGAKS